METSLEVLLKKRLCLRMLQGDEIIPCSGLLCNKVTRSRRLDRSTAVALFNELSSSFYCATRRTLIIISLFSLPHRLFSPQSPSLLAAVCWRWLWGSWWIWPGLQVLRVAPTPPLFHRLVWTREQDCTTGENRHFYSTWFVHIYRKCSKDTSTISIGKYQHR